MSFGRPALFALALALVACGDERKNVAEPVASAAEAAPSGAAQNDVPKTQNTASVGFAPAPPSGVPSGAAAASATASASATVSASASATVSASASAEEPSATDGDCKLLRGPVRLTKMGAFAFGPENAGRLTIGINKDGRVAWESPQFPDPPAATPKGAFVGGASPSSTALLPGAPAGDGATVERLRLSACAVAGGFSFCSDADGNIVRSPISGEGQKVVAKGRPATPVRAVAAGGHVYYAFLANQKTTEGVIVRAFAAVDDETPIPLSEDGSGATDLGLVARENDVLAMYIDARTALTPVHARTLRADGKLVRGTDAVVFVGAGATGHVRGAIGRGRSGPVMVFVPGPVDDTGFGVVTIPISGEPKDDMPGTWSHYPAGIDHVALAATTDTSPVRLVRSRPLAKDLGLGLALELGHVEASGVFKPRCVLAKSSSFSDPVLTTDQKGSLWVAYTNSKGTWVEERGAL